MKPSSGLTIALIFMIAGWPLAAQTSQTTNSTPKAYTSQEFPQWLLDLRRAEIILFGSLPFTMFFAISAVDSYRFATNQWNTAYAPWPLKSAGAVAMTEDESRTAFTIGGLAAILVCVIDQIIVQLERASAARAAAERTVRPYVIDTSPWPPDSQVDAAAELP